jgi:hypothetical protein
VDGSFHLSEHETCQTCRDGVSSHRGAKTLRCSPFRSSSPATAGEGSRYRLSEKQPPESRVGEGTDDSCANRVRTLLAGLSRCGQSKDVLTDKEWGPIPRRSLSYSIPSRPR